MQAQMQITGIVLDANGEPLVQLVTRPEGIGMRAVREGEHCACGVGHPMHPAEMVCGVVTPVEPSLLAGTAPSPRTCMCTTPKATPIYRLEKLLIAAPSGGVPRGVFGPH